MQDLISDQEARTPGLGDVPLFGNLFKHTKQETSKTELVILLKPIVADDDAQIEAMNQSLARLKTMRGRIAPGS